MSTFIQILSFLVISTSAIQCGTGVGNPSDRGPVRQVVG